MTDFTYLMLLGGIIIKKVSNKIDNLPKKVTQKVQMSNSFIEDCKKIVALKE